jgi:2-polyprenyl-3-methyl-5-hydroxy-6-metoxy-1,4-benzoquinol methylase
MIPGRGAVCYRFLPRKWNILRISCACDIPRFHTSANRSDATTKYSPPEDQQPTLPDAWQKIFDANTTKDLQQVYADWSLTYDRDSIDEYGYRGPRRGAEEFHHQLSALGFPKTARLVDIGAGTGLVGKHLHSFGYQDLTALDFSREMLQVASEKNCYNKLICIDLNQPLDEIEQTTKLTSPAFDAAVSVGTFTHKHVGVEALLNLVALVKPGGLLTLSMSEMFYNDVENGVQDKLQELLTEEKLESIGVTEPELYTPKISATIEFRVWSFRVL